MCTWKNSFAEASKILVEYRPGENNVVALN